jgi:hypothetical protein
VERGVGGSPVPGGGSSHRGDRGLSLRGWGGPLRGHSRGGPWALCRPGDRAPGPGHRLRRGERVHHGHVPGDLCGGPGRSLSKGSGEDRPTAPGTGSGHGLPPGRHVPGLPCLLCRRGRPLHRAVGRRGSCPAHVCHRLSGRAPPPRPGSGPAAEASAPGGALPHLLLGPPPLRRLARHRGPGGGPAWAICTPAASDGGRRGPPSRHEVSRVPLPPSLRRVPPSANDRAGSFPANGDGSGGRRARDDGRARRPREARANSSRGRGTLRC